MSSGLFNKLNPRWLRPLVDPALNDKFNMESEVELGETLSNSVKAMSSLESNLDDLNKVTSVLGAVTNAPNLFNGELSVEDASNRLKRETYSLVDIVEDSKGYSLETALELSFESLNKRSFYLLDKVVEVNSESLDNAKKLDINLFKFLRELSKKVEVSLEITSILEDEEEIKKDCLTLTNSEAKILQLKNEFVGLTTIVEGLGVLEGALKDVVYSARGRLVSNFKLLTKLALEHSNILQELVTRTESGEKIPKEAFDRVFDRLTTCMKDCVEEIHSCDSIGFTEAVHLPGNEFLFTPTTTMEIENNDGNVPNIHQLKLIKAKLNSEEANLETTLDALNREEMREVLVGINNIISIYNGDKEVFTELSEVVKEANQTIKDLIKQIKAIKSDDLRANLQIKTLASYVTKFNLINYQSTFKDVDLLTIRYLWTLSNLVIKSLRCYDKAKDLDITILSEVRFNDKRGS